MRDSHVCCPNCGSENWVMNGKNVCGSQRYKCKACGKTRVLHPKPATKKINEELVFRTFTERNSYRSTARLFGISHTTVMNMLKKKPVN